MDKLVQRSNFQTNICISLECPTRVITISDSIFELLGFKADDFLAEKVTLQSRIHAHDQDIANYLFSTEIKPAFGSFNIRLRHADGLIRCVKGEFTKVKDQTGDGIMLKLLLKNAKSLWNQHTALPMCDGFRAILENTDDYIYFKDNNHIFTAASQTLVDITNPSENWTDLLGQTDYDVFPEEYADNYYDLEKQIFSGVKVAQSIQTFIDNEGNQGWVDNRKYPIKNDAGKIVGLFGIARDITKQKMAEQALFTSDFRWRFAVEVAAIEKNIVLNHLKKVLSSKLFANSFKRKRLLEYLVNESYAGRGCKLKAFTIAVEALGADSTFDSNHDSVVRVIALRLRQALLEYYLTHGDEDSVRFHLPKGNYEIAFLRKIASCDKSDLKLEQPDKRKGLDRRSQ